ncbi:MAG: PAS domain S-box protein, partial [Chitinophagaceae bacterium]|nr:PAS domain S-box protein [Chitinophagaceae bacterium]
RYSLDRSDSLKTIKQSESRLKTFFQRGPDAVIIINENQEILEWNSKAELIFGYRANEVIGQPLSETIIPHQYREAHIKGMQHFLKTGEGPVLNKTLELTALHKTGHEFYINLSVSNVKLGNEWVFIAFLSDISERKKTEEALIRKEAELLQVKLQEERKDEFISIASHELKTPLTTIKAYTQLAMTLSDGCTPVVTQYLQKADEYAGKLNDLINELLDVSKIHAGKLRLTQTEVEMDSFLSEVLASMQQITPTHTISLEKNEPAKVKIDSLRLEQVIANLISNAAKYSPGKDQIIVNAVKKDDALVVSFTDFGIGIPKEKLSKIFDRFYRVDELSQEFSGLGIGLFITSEIVKQHGGKIWAESKEGEGSTFYFSLPIVS